MVLFVHQTTTMEKIRHGRGNISDLSHMCLSERFQYFNNRTYRFYKAHGAKDNHFKARLCEMFLNDYHEQEKLLKQEHTRNNQQLQDEIDDELTELQIEENFTFLGIKNKQNRFIKVRPNEFADIIKLDKWKKYFERIQKDELFDAKITYTTADGCKFDYKRVAI